MKSKIAVLIGGTFHPITKAHVQMGVLAKKNFPDADIIYVPSNLDFISKWKQLPKSDEYYTKHRIELIQDAIEPLGFHCSTVETEQITDGSTYNLVQHYKKEYDCIYICIGMDKVKEIQKWANSKQLLKEVNIILFTRNNQRLEHVPNYLQHTSITEIDLPKEYQEISSTKVRQALQNHDLKSVKHMLSKNTYKNLKYKGEINEIN